MKHIIRELFKKGWLALLLGAFSAGAQLPECDKIYMDKLNVQALTYPPDIYIYDPLLPVSPTNPTLNTISKPPNCLGLAVSRVLGAGNTDRTFYTVDYTTEVLWYYDPVALTWVNTGHTVGNPGAQTHHLGAGGDYLYAVDPLVGNVYRYDGTGNAILLTTITDFAIANNSGSTSDIMADCDGNFYLLRARATFLNPAAFLRKYSPAGVLLQEWTITGSLTSSLSGYGINGFQIIGNTLYTDSYIYTGPITLGSFPTSTQIASATILPTTVDFTNAPLTGPLTGYQNAVTSDWAACDVTDMRLPEIAIATAETAICGTQNITFWVSSLQNQGDTPAYQWLVNGVAVPGATDSVYTYAPQNGDVVTCELTSSEYCIIAMTATSNAVTMIVDNAVQPELRYSPNAFCISSEEPVLPVVNTSGGVFSATQGLDINPVTGAINASTSVPGEYVVTYTNPTPVVCPLYSTATIINVYPPADASIEMDMFKRPVCLGDSVVLRAPEVKGSIYYWEPAERIIGLKDEATAVAGRKTAGFVTLTVYGKGLCMDRDSVWIDEGESCCRLFIPNAFSPNADGLNDRITMDVREIQAINNFRIYNRYGRVVFETSNAKVSWDGTSNGKPCDPGVYYYSLSYTCDNGLLMQEKGDITLIR